MGWTDERVEQLKRLWNQGLSASQIAAELGQGVTRNAVIGKVHRLGLSGRAKAPASSAPRVRKTTRAPSHPMTMNRGNLALAPRAIPVARPVVEISAATGRRCRGAFVGARHDYGIARDHVPLAYG